MPDSLLWALAAPLVASLVALAALAASGSGKRRTFDLPVFVMGAGSVVLSGMLLISTPLNSTAFLGDRTLLLGAPARLLLPVAVIAIVASLVLAWNAHIDSRGSGDVAVAVFGAAGAFTLVAGALIAQGITLTVLLLCGAGLVIAAAVVLQAAREPLPEADDLDARVYVAARLTGGVKHLVVVLLGTGLLVGGSLLVERYALNLENRGLLQLGMGLLFTGLLIRTGAMPFSISSGDLLRSASPLAVVALGGVAPAVIIAGLQVLSSHEKSLVSTEGAGWLAGLAALLAGIRSAGVGRQVPGARSGPAVLAILVGMSAALHIAWALFGVFSGSRAGAAGAVLLAANLSLAVPLAVVGRRHSRLALYAAGASLVGLPPLGGFAGVMLVAQAAANLNGAMLATLLAGTFLAGVAWVSAHVRGLLPEPDLYNGRRSWDPVIPLAIVLAAGQIGLFLAAGRVASELAAWSDAAPWLIAP